MEEQKYYPKKNKFYLENIGSSTELEIIQKLIYNYYLIFNCVILNLKNIDSKSWKK